MDINIRRLELRDLTEIIGLIKNELGYDGYNSDIYDRIKRIYDNDNYVTFVAEDNGRVIGFMGLMRGLAFELDGEYIRIIALAVRDEYQNHGVGTQLAAMAEIYASEIGASNIVISSGLKRADAHIFYGSVGYIKKGFTFIKQLKADAPHVSGQPDIFTPIAPRKPYLDEAELDVNDD